MPEPEQYRTSNPFSFRSTFIQSTRFLDYFIILQCSNGAALAALYTRYVCFLHAWPICWICTCPQCHMRAKKWREQSHSTHTHIECVAVRSLECAAEHSSAVKIAIKFKRIIKLWHLQRAVSVCVYWWICVCGTRKLEVPKYLIRQAYPCTYYLLLHTTLTMCVCLHMNVKCRVCVSAMRCARVVKVRRFATTSS